MASQVIAEFAGLDVLVNNAGFQMACSPGLEHVTPEQLDRVMRTNLYALFWLTQAAVTHLKPGSCVTNNSSIQAYDPSVSLLDYAAPRRRSTTSP